MMRTIPAIHAERYMRSVLDDIVNIVKVSGITPRLIRIYVAEADEAYRAVLECVNAGKTDMRSVMADIASSPERAHLRKRPGDIARYLKDVLSEPSEVRLARLADDAPGEMPVLESEMGHVVKTEFDCEVVIYRSDTDAANDPGGKARFARAYHPAIFIE